MAISVRHEDNSFERYIAEVRAVWGDGKDPELPFKVRALMEKMLKSTAPEEPWMEEILRDGKPSRELYRDPQHGFIHRSRGAVDGGDSARREALARALPRPAARLHPDGPRA